jgi:hypothetical protein
LHLNQILRTIIRRFPVSPVFERQTRKVLAWICLIHRWCNRRQSDPAVYDTLRCLEIGDHSLGTMSMSSIACAFAL